MIEGADAVACTDCGIVDPSIATTTDDLSESGDVQNKRSGNQPVSMCDLVDAVEIRDSSDENLVELLASLDKVSEALDVDNSVQIRSAENAVSAWEHRVSHGRSKDAVVGGCVYAATREQGCPRPLTIVSDEAGTTESTLNKSYRAIVSELDLEMPIIGPSAYTQYLGQRLHLPSPVIENVDWALEEEVDLNGNPAGIAVAVLYIGGTDAGYDLTLSEAGMVAGVAKETVWRNVREIRPLEIS
jgi:transcription initiation factor TFIIIB Brf1 subunit/transcription initiation factor TFIIB